MMEQIKEGQEERIGNEQFYKLVTSKEVSWQSIIHELINTEQLDPWDIDLALLAQRYIERVRELEEANFFISSKVLLAASLLLRLKSEILLHKYIKNIDEILFGKKEEDKTIEKIEIDESELPLLYPKTPLPRYRRVSLQELMSALDKALLTETRRVRKETAKILQKKAVDIVLPKRKTSIRDRIRKIYSKILTSFKKKKTKISYSELTGNKRDEKIACFLPCLHLDTQYKLFLEQEKHFSEIYIWLYKHYKKQIALGKIKEEIELEKEIAEKTGFDNPLANFSDIASEIMKGEIS
jgi:segregation and condensation protein A